MGWKASSICRLISGKLFRFSSLSSHPGIMLPSFMMPTEKTADISVGENVASGNMTFMSNCDNECDLNR